MLINTGLNEKEYGAGLIPEIMVKVFGGILLWPDFEFYMDNYMFMISFRWLCFGISILAYENIKE